MNPISQAIAFYKFCKKNKDIYQVVHFQSIGANGFFDIIAASMAGIKWRIAHSHIANDVKPARNSKKTTTSAFRKHYVLMRQALIRKIVSRFSTHYFGCSKMACDWMFTKDVNAKGKSVVVNNPIDVKRFIFNESDREYFREKLGIKDKFVIGHIGRFVFSKNHDFLLKVFQKVVQLKPDAVLVLVGGGHLKGEIENQIQQLGIADNVILFGETNEVYRLYNAFDMFVFPSHYEGLGIVLVEAQANGLPTIASDTIPHEVKLTDNFEFISLQNGCEDWANKIVYRSNEPRITHNSDKIYAAKYDIRDVSAFLQDTYIKLSEGRNV